MVSGFSLFRYFPIGCKSAIDHPNASIVDASISQNYNELIEIEMAIC